MRRVLVAAAMVAGMLTLSSGTSHAVEFCNTAPILGNSSGPGPRPSQLYPSTIEVSGLTGTITDVNIRLIDIDTRPDAGGLHWAEDLDVLVVAPNGTNAIVMSDAGGNNDTSSGPVENVNLVLDDQAPTQLPADTALTSGTFRPVNDEDADPQQTPDDLWNPPAPTPSGNVALSTFNGGNPNGTWSLFAQDDYGQSAVDINGGWCVDIITSTTTTGTGPTSTTPTTAPTSTTPTTAPTSTTPTTVPTTCDGRTPTIVGTSGADYIQGTPGPDVILALGGGDTIRGLGGDDVICGGDGQDQIDGGDGNDRIFGDAGNDQLTGAAGNDVVNGGAGADRVIGADGNDTLIGGPDGDQCLGDAGTDTATACEQITGVP